MSVAEEANIDAYFERIGFAGSIAPSLETLSLLHLQHAVAIPFENLDPLMGAPVRLDLRDLEQKLLFDRRGGYCLEHNLLFKAVLESLDFEVRAHAATVLWGSDDVPGEATHLVLTADLNGGSYLCDVGFGGNTPTAPLRLRNGAEQVTPHETYRLVEADGVWRAEVQLGGAWRAMFQFSREAITPDEIAAMNEAVSTRGFFTEHLVAAKADKSGRFVLRDDDFTIYRSDGTATKRSIASLQEMKDTLSGAFTIALPADERLDAALARCLPGGRG